MAKVETVWRWGVVHRARTQKRWYPAWEVFLNRNAAMQFLRDRFCGSNVMGEFRVVRFAMSFTEPTPERKSNARRNQRIS